MEENINKYVDKRMEDLDKMLLGSSNYKDKREEIKNDIKNSTEYMMSMPINEYHEDINIVGHERFYFRLIKKEVQDGVDIDDCERMYLRETN